VRARERYLKHVISFEEAQTVFYDNAILFGNTDHSIDEERYLFLGFSQTFKILFRPCPESSMSSEI
jgi:hypothetical protein